MEIAVFAGAAWGVAYAMWRKREHPTDSIVPLQPMNPSTYTATPVRNRIADSVGTGAELGIGLPQSEPGLDLDPLQLYANSLARSQAPPPASLHTALPDRIASMHTQPNLDSTSTAYLANAEPLKWPEPTADPNALQPGVITTLNNRRARLEGPGYQPPIRAQLRPVPLVDTGLPAPTGNMDAIDWSAFAVQPTPVDVSDQPGEVVVAQARDVQAQQQQQTIQGLATPRMTADKRADRAILIAESSGMLDRASLNAPLTAVDRDNCAAAYVAYGGRYSRMKSTTYRLIIAYKLGCASDDPQIGPIVKRLLKSF